MSDREPKPLDPIFAQVVYRDLYQRLVDAISNDAPEGSLRDEILAAINDPVGINQVFLRRYNWWQRLTALQQRLETTGFIGDVPCFASGQGVNE